MKQYFVIIPRIHLPAYFAPILVCGCLKLDRQMCIIQSDVLYSIATPPSYLPLTLTLLLLSLPHLHFNNIVMVFGI